MERPEIPASRKRLAVRNTMPDRGDRDHLIVISTITAKVVAMVTPHTHDFSEGMSICWRQKSAPPFVAYLT